MRGCDISDQLMTSYSMLRRSVKWWRKLFFHLFALCINNAYIVYKMFNNNPVPHDTFMEQLAKSLVQSSLQSHTVSVTRPRSPKPPNPITCLHERHFPSPIGKTSTKSGSKKCSVCNFGKKAIVSKGYKGVKLPPKLTSTCVNLAMFLCAFILVLNCTTQKMIMKIPHSVITCLAYSTLSIIKTILFSQILLSYIANNNAYFHINSAILLM